MPYTDIMHSCVQDSVCLSVNSERDRQKRPLTVQECALFFCLTYIMHSEEFYLFYQLVLSLLCPFLSPRYLPGIDFKVKTIEVDGKKVKLQVW